MPPEAREIARLANELASVQIWLGQPQGAGQGMEMLARARAGF